MSSTSLGRKTHIFAIPLLLGLLASCKPTEQGELQIQEIARKKEQCRDQSYCGDPKDRPAYDEQTQALYKWNGKWFVSPRQFKYMSGMAFYWPSKLPSTEAPAPNDWLIYVLPRSYDLPMPPDGYARFEIAAREGRIIERSSVRANLERIKYFYKNPLTGEVNKERPATAYIAKDRKAPDGQPPVFSCETNPDPKLAGGGAGFEWRDGIYVEVIVRSGNVCEDWPELYDEISRLLSLTKEI